MRRDRLRRGLSFFSDRRIYFVTTFRRMPTASAEGQIESEGDIGKVSGETRLQGTLQIGTRPSAFAVGTPRNVAKNRCRAIASTRPRSTRSTPQSSASSVTGSPASVACSRVATPSSRRSLRWP